MLQIHIFTLSFEAHLFFESCRITSDNNKVTYMPTDRVLCTGTLEWEPAPSSIRCTDCDLEFVGDGVCDELNNVASCGFDDGDCCMSTKKFPGPIETYPFLCGDGCLCKDPNARENLAVSERPALRRVHSSQTYRYMNGLKYRLQLKRPTRLEERLRNNRNPPT